MAKTEFEIAWTNLHGKRLTRKRALVILENEMKIKKRQSSFLVKKGLYDEYFNWTNGRDIQTNEKSDPSSEAIGLITEYLNLEKTRDNLFTLLTHYLTYEDGFSTEHKEDVCFTIKILNEAISKLMKTS
jgi:hypothetical protein